MADLPIGIGDEEAQRAFLRNNAAFVKECGLLYELLKKVFVRGLVTARAEHQIEQIGEGLQLTEAESAVVADRKMAEVVVFYLGQCAAEDFGELLILSGNGRGVGAYKILRGMYERIVQQLLLRKTRQKRVGSCPTHLSSGKSC
jgi:hypothetical protein